MTTPYRLALSEIPGRLASMSFEQPDDEDEPTPPPNILLNGNAVSSPDEIVIRQRGRRRITLSWSPDKVALNNRSPCPFEKTPTKTQSPMTLRSSPRKRLMTACAADQSDNGCGFDRSPRKKTTPVKNLWSSPIIKKTRLGEEEPKPLAQNARFDVPLSTLLLGLSQEQLIKMIQNLSETDVKIETKIRNSIPLPDLRPLENELMTIKRNIYKSLPNNRLCKKTDSVAFSRASTHLSELKTAITAHSTKLSEGLHWDALIDYTIIAWNYVRSTPIWDNNSHNSIRRQCFKVLSNHCLNSLKMGGLMLGTQRLQSVERTIKEWAKDYEDALACVSMLNKMFLKYRTSL